jgi:uncharacterized lipoprotein YmbA
MMQVKKVNMTNNNNQQFYNSIYMFIVLCLFIIALSLCSCNTEKKALKPYKLVNSDVDSSFKDKKKELIARVCAVNFPIETKTIVIDSTKTKVIKVTDNAAINRLKQLLKDCANKPINIDSIYNSLPLDTVYVDKYHTTTITKKDTINNWRTANEIQALQNGKMLLNATLNAKIDDYNKEVTTNKGLQKERNKWRLYFFLLLLSGIAYKVAKTYLKTKI